MHPLSPPHTKSTQHVFALHVSPSVPQVFACGPQQIFTLSLDPCCAQKHPQVSSVLPSPHVVSTVGLVMKPHWNMGMPLTAAKVPVWHLIATDGSHVCVPRHVHSSASLMIWLYPVHLQSPRSLGLTAPQLSFLLAQLREGLVVTCRCVSRIGREGQKRRRQA